MYLSIDIETFSSKNLQQCGVYAYVDDPNFTILLFGYAFDDGPVHIVDLASGESLPPEVIDALGSEDIIKTAYNANFERTCISKYLKMTMPPDQWRCTMVQALTLGMPGSLEMVAKTLNLSEQKDKAGKALIRYFCTPLPQESESETGHLFKTKPKIRRLPEDDLEKWEQFKAYCAQDVETERALRKKLERFPLLDKEQKLWELDQLINDRGIRIHPVLVANAITCDMLNQEHLIAAAREITNLENPNSVGQLKSWIEEETGTTVDSLDKKTVSALLKETDNKDVQKALELRQELAKTSVSKYQAMGRAVCLDDRVRGLLQFYGASRTGRWAGRLVQVQNLPRNDLEDLDLARKLLVECEFELIELLFGSVSDTLSQLIRTAFVPSPGHRFIVADFSAIEARVIAWLAGEKWRLDVFNSHGKIYEASAAQMFNVPVESIDKGSPLRQKGKVAELALGYGGSTGALIAMGALNMGLTDDELPGLVEAWRNANPAITSLWWEIEAAALSAVRDRTVSRMQYGLAFQYEAGILFIRLPSGRKLAYVKPKIEPGKFGKPCLTYEGYEQGKWSRLQTYGPKLTENIVQAISRDCLAEAMLRLDKAGYKIVMHVHDEVVIDAPNDFGSLTAACEIMGQPINWAPGLPLRADGYETDYYKKD